MSEQEKKNCPEYQAGKAAAEWLQSLSEEQRKQMDIVDAFAYGVLHGWNNPNWIPVEEQLPAIDCNFASTWDCSDDVYIYLATGTYCVGRFEHDKLKNEVYWVLYGIDKDIPVTHWMQLPTPPQGKEANNE